jgi:transposase
VLRPFLEAWEINVSETWGTGELGLSEKHAEDEPPLELSDRARLRELEREIRELRMKADFLSKAAAVCHKRRGKAEASGHPRSRLLDAVPHGR